MKKVSFDYLPYLKNIPKARQQYFLSAKTYAKI